MTASWSTWQDGLPPLFATLIGLAAPSSVAWASQPRSMSPGPRAQLDVIASPSVGVEDRRYVSDDVATFDLDGETIVGTLVEELTGQREIVVQVTAWNEAQSLPVSARALLDRLRTRLAWGSTTTALRAMGLAFVRTEAPVALEPVEDGRIVSRWAMDVAFAYASIELDASNPTNWFETARIASQSLRDEGGSPLPSQVDVTIDLIPEA